MCPSPSFNSHQLSAILFHLSLPTPAPHCVCAKAILLISGEESFCLISNLSWTTYSWACKFNNTQLGSALVNETSPLIAAWMPWQCKVLSQFLNTHCQCLHVPQTNSTQLANWHWSTDHTFSNTVLEYFKANPRHSFISPIDSACMSNA